MSRNAVDEGRHAELRDSLAAAALDALPARERDAVLAHAASCEECGLELAALRDATAALATLAPAARVDAVRGDAIRTRLLARTAADRRLRMGPASPASPGGVVAREAGAPRPLSIERGRWSRPAWVAMAASVALAASVGALYAVARERSDLRAALAASDRESAAASARLDDAAVSLGRLQGTISSLTGPSVRVVELTTAGTKQPVARMFWDRSTNTWTMFAHNLRQPASGKTYQLWLVTRDAKISAGTFLPNAGGSAMVSAQYALRDPLQAIAVTIEPTGGVPQPTGPIVIIGAAGE